MYVPKVSVIIPVYNVEKYLRQCLDSVVNQTLKDIEIICVNDDSPDNSLEILNEYAAKDSRIKVFSKENEGLGAASARNLGLDNATGEYLSILDSDDFFDLEMLEKSYNKAKATNADVVVFGAYRYDENTEQISVIEYLLNKKYLPEHDLFSHKDWGEFIFQITYAAPWNKLFKREFIENHKIRFQRVKIIDDFYFTQLSIALAEKITVLPEYLCYYREGTGVSQTDSLSISPDSSWMALAKLKESLVECNIYDEVKQSFVNIAARILRNNCDNKGVYSLFEDLYNKCKTELFDLFDITGKPKEYFYDERVYDWCCMVSTHSAGELAFESARAYGSKNTTAVLRFELPKGKIPKGCKLAIIGCGVAAKFYYSQILLSDYCDVVVWVDKNGSEKLNSVKKFEDLASGEFEYALITYTQQKLIDEAKEYLKAMGIREDNVILSDI